MNNNALVITALTYGTIEFAYLRAMYPLYLGNIRRVLGDARADFTFDMYAVLAYACILLATYYLLFPHITPETSYLEAAQKGVMLGLAMYGVYNFTNRATLGERWDTRLMWIDLTYGVFIMTLIAVVFKWARSRA